MSPIYLFTLIQSIMFDFEKSEVYRKAKQFNLTVNTTLTELTIDEATKSLIRSHSNDVFVNIAKGMGSYNKEDRRDKQIEARSSLFAGMALLDSLRDENGISEEKYQVISDIGDEVSRILYAIVKKTELVH